MDKPVVHALSADGIDYTLCGYAYEGACMPDDDEEPLLAASGDLVTCDRCRTIIVYCKMFKRNRQP